jgi:hypothetical protein
VNVSSAILTNPVRENATRKVPWNKRCLSICCSMLCVMNNLVAIKRQECTVRHMPIGEAKISGSDVLHFL